MSGLVKHEVKAEPRQLQTFVPVDSQPPLPRVPPPVGLDAGQVDRGVYVKDSKVRVAVEPGEAWRASAEVTGLVRKMVLRLAGCFPSPGEGIAYRCAAGLAKAMRRNDVSPDELREVWGLMPAMRSKLLYPQQRTGLHAKPPCYVVEFMKSFPDLFHFLHLTSVEDIQVMVQKGEVLTPHNLIPSPPVLVFRLAPNFRANPEAVAQRHPDLQLAKGCPQLRLPSAFCCFCAREGRGWVGHASAQCQAQTVERRDSRRRTAGLPLGAEEVRRKQVLHRRWDAVHKERERVMEMQRNIITGNARGVYSEVPWLPGDRVVTEAVRIREDNWKYLIGKEGKNLKMLENQYKVIIVVPQRSHETGQRTNAFGNREWGVTVRGKPENTATAKACLEAKYNAEESLLSEELRLARQVTFGKKRQRDAFVSAEDEEGIRAQRARLEMQPEEAGSWRLPGMPAPQGGGRAESERSGSVWPVVEDLRPASQSGDALGLPTPPPAPEKAEAPPAGKAEGECFNCKAGAPLGWYSEDGAGEPVRSCPACKPEAFTEVRKTPDGEWLTMEGFVDMFGRHREWNDAA